MSLYSNRNPKTLITVRLPALYIADRVFSNEVSHQSSYMISRNITAINYSFIQIVNIESFKDRGTWGNLNNESYFEMKMILMLSFFFFFDSVSLFWELNTCSRELSHWVKLVAAKPDDLSSISGRSRLLFQVFLLFLYLGWAYCKLIYQHIHK